MLVLRDRRNEKEMKVKPATSFKIIHIVLFTKSKKKKKKKKVRQCAKQKWVNSTFQPYVTKSLSNIQQEFLNQIFWITFSDPTI